jgi:hypothetical protein
LGPKGVGVSGVGERRYVDEQGGEGMSIRRGAVVSKASIEVKPVPMMDSAQKIADEVMKTLREKNADYGDSFSISRDDFGFDAFLVRASDKWNRMKTLRNRTGEVADESLEDTIRDMIGYCLLELAYREQKR